MGATCDQQADDFLNSLRLDGPQKDQTAEILETDTIIIQGLRYDTTEFIIEDDLIHAKAAFESVKLIKSKTGESRGFAFVKFFTKNLAKHWFNKNNQQVEIDGVICQYEYGRPLEYNDWECVDCASLNYTNRQSCFRCGLPREFNTQPETAIKNVGSRDIGTVPTNMLLIRGLDPSSSAQSIFDSLIKDKVAITRVLLVKSRVDHSSLCFGFAEFTNLEGANTLLERIFHPKLPKPLIVADAVVTTCYAHMGSFFPVSETAEYISRCVVDSGKTMYYRYWDESTYCEAHPILDLPTKPSPQTITSTKQIIAKIEAKSKSVEMPKKLAIQLQKWSTKHNRPDIPGISYSIIFQKLPSKQQLNDIYSNLDKNACMICQRKFKSLEELQKHQALSKLHQQMIRHHRKRMFNSLLENELHRHSNMFVAEEPQQVRTFVPTRFGIRGDNIGNQLMRKMGWTQGAGLGPQGKGITRAIKARRRPKNLGLGSQSKAKPKVK